MKIENIPKEITQHAKLAGAAGWTEIVYSQLLTVPFGVPPEGHIDRGVVEKAGIKCEVPPIQELIENLPAGSEMDALVAEILGYDVLGITHCLPDPEGLGYYLAYERLEDWEIVCSELRPVYLYQCACEFAKPNDKKYFGHVAGCLEICKEYSEEDNYAFEAVDWLVGKGYPVTISTYQDNSYCQVYEIEEKRSWADWYSHISDGEGKTRPLAICRALLFLAQVLRKT